MTYNHYIAIDWSQTVLSIARMTPKADKINLISIETSLYDVKDYLDSFRGSKILTIEENSVSQWLYTELSPHVDKLIICDPYRNHLLKEGPKTDDIDAIKLVKLLRAGFLKEVYHSGNDFIHLRKVSSAHTDLVKAIVRMKNQRSAILRSVGLRKNSREDLDHPYDKFVMCSLEEQLVTLEGERVNFSLLFRQLQKKHPMISRLTKIPGIGDILAVKIVSRVVEPRRFKSKGQFLSYCGLVKHELSSGGKLLGKKNTRYCREMKYAFKTATMAALSSENEFHDYYMHLKEEKRYPDHVARHATCRRIAIIVWGVLKNDKSYQPKFDKGWSRYTKKA